MSQIDKLYDAELEVTEDEYEIQLTNKGGRILAEEVHSQISIDIGGKEVELDKNIIDAVRFLNKIQGLRTIYSCQGSSNLSVPWEPYISFVVVDIHALYEVVFMMQEFHKYLRSNNLFYGKSIIINLNETMHEDRYLHFAVRFLNTDILNKFNYLINHGGLSGRK